MASLNEPRLIEDGTTVKSPAKDTNNGTTMESSPFLSLRLLWTKYYPRGAFGEGAAVPGSSLKLIIVVLLSFVGIKSQGQVEFPFKTHPYVIMVSITSVLMHGLACRAGHVISAARLDPSPFMRVLLCGER